jgi:folate-binding protein YgfZ
MSRMKAALLPDRGVVKIAGEGARNFLHGLVTADVLSLTPGAARFCALLTPQGKIIADFFVVVAPTADGGAFFLDVPRARIGTLIERLNVYKLRAKVLIEDLSEILGVIAAWDGSGTTNYGLSYTDPRLPALGLRALIPPQRSAETAVDFTYGDAFPHETDMDQLGGIDFGKGCYVGQEVVSRMEHRGTARTRAVPVCYDSAAPPAGATISAGGQQMGTMGSAAGGRGMALLRLDRVADALSRGDTLTAAGLPIRVVKPDWAKFAFPGDTKAAE